MIHHNRIKRLRHAASAVWIAVALAAVTSLRAADILNAYNFPFFTIESDHFTVSYHEGLEDVAREVASICEELYDIYNEVYHLKTPRNTTALVINDVGGNGWAMDLTNTILVSANAFDFNLRGTHDWLWNVVTHEYAHIMSITSAHKLPHNMPYFQFGYFNHPNEQNRLEAFHVYPGDILPPWFFEGIAQYEATRHGSEAWDTHRDMILRSLILSGKEISYDHMNAFAGRGDDYEKTYNHGFGLVKYIAETYGYCKIVSILRESQKFWRFNFDRSIKAVLGKSARRLYQEWVQSMKERYTQQIDSIGTQVYGKKINEHGFDNFWPKFALEKEKIYFLSNHRHAYSIRSLYSYSLSDTVDEDERIQREMPVRGFYSLHDSAGFIAYTTTKSRTSKLPTDKGGIHVPDVFLDTLSDVKPGLFHWKKSERQVTTRGFFTRAVLSPSGDYLACTRHSADRFFLCLADTAGNTVRLVYPDTTDTIQAGISYIFSLDWSPDGHSIAMSYLDTEDRKIGIFDTLTREFTVVCNTPHDERDPRFSRDARWLYFSSDRTGIFNLYRFNLRSSELQRISNVSGGAFAPDVSSDNRVVYANYDADGYGIYLMDSIEVVEDFGSSKSFLSNRSPNKKELPHITTTPPRPYVRFPQKSLIMPTLFMEQAVTDEDDVFQGRNSWKAGVIINLFDPFAMSGFNTGSWLGGYLLIDPRKLHKFIDPAIGFINPEVDYDIGLFGSTMLLPLPLSASYMQRSITGRDWFIDERELDADTEAESAVRKLDYNVTLYYADLMVPFYLSRGGSLGGFPMPLAGLYLYGALDRTDVTLLLKDDLGVTFRYNISRGIRLGGFLAYRSIYPEPTMSISPRGTYLKLFTTLETENLIDDEKSFNASGQENYNTYLYQFGSLDLKWSTGLPWSKKQALYLEGGGSLVELLKTPEDIDSFPYYYEPVIWRHPGYAYLVSDTLISQTQISTEPPDTVSDTLPFYRGVVAGNALLHGTASLRFPLWPGLIDKKLGFLYLERLYGVLNLTGGAGWRDIRDALDFNREDWLVSTGAELRLEAQTFYRYPLALTCKWDYGLDRPAPVGGHRFSLMAGFSFDNWDYIESPEYHRRNAHRNFLPTIGPRSR